MNTYFSEEVFRYTILILYLAFVIIYFINLKKSDAINMDTSPLFKQKLFKASLMIPFVSFLSFGSLCWIGHSFQLDAYGLNNFITISKLPLAMLSMAVPLGVVVNNMHRTIQTSAQLYEAQRKNTSDLYYSHQKNSLEHFNNMVSYNLKIIEHYNHDNSFKFKTHIKKPLQLYRAIFNDMSYSNFELRVSFEFKYQLLKTTAMINSTLKAIVNEVEKKKGRSVTYIIFKYSLFEKYLWELKRLLCMESFNRPYNYRLDLDGKYLITDFSCEAEAMCVLFFYFDMVRDVCELISFKNNIDYEYRYEIGRLYGVLDDIFHQTKFKALENNKSDIGFFKKK